MPTPGPLANQAVDPTELSLVFDFLQTLDTVGITLTRSDLTRHYA